MTSRKGPVTLIVIGALLSLSSLWGVAGTVVGMIRAFDTLQSTGPVASEQLAGNISMSLRATAVGLIMAPIGLIVLIDGIDWLVRINKKNKSSNHH